MRGSIGLSEIAYDPAFVTDQAQRANGIGVRGVLGRLEAHRHMALRRQVVDFVGLRFLHDADQIGRVRQIPIVEDQLRTMDMGILVNVLNATRVEGRRAPLDPMNQNSPFRAGDGLGTPHPAL